MLSCTASDPGCRRKKRPANCVQLKLERSLVCLSTVGWVLRMMQVRYAAAIESTALQRSVCFASPRCPMPASHSEESQLNSKVRALKMLAELHGLGSMLPFLYSCADKLKLQHADQAGQDSRPRCWKEPAEARLLQLTVAS